MKSQAKSDNYTQTLNAQGAFQPVPGLVSLGGVTGETGQPLEGQ